MRLWSIPDTYHFDKDGEPVRRPLLRRFFASICFVLAVILAFGAGRLTARDGGERGVVVNFDPALTQNLSAAGSGQEAPGSVVASSKGTKYYYSYCANTISEKNKVTFATAALAEAAGYALAANCRAR